MKTFLPRHVAGASKVFRYHVRPLRWICSPRWPGVDQLSKVSTSLYVCGADTTCQPRSSKPGADAPAGSALMKCQSGLKFSVCREPLRGASVVEAMSPADPAGDEQ